MRCIEINGRRISSSHRPYIIAELSGNHNGDINRALRLIDAAKAAGADAVKLQTYTANTLTIDCDKADFIIGEGPWKGRKLYELYQEASTPWVWHERLFEYGQRQGITLFSTPFDETAVDFLEQLKVPAYKIASFELIDHPLVAKIAMTGKPVIMSTGMASETEIDEAVRLARSSGADQLIILHCNSGYPTPISDSRLASIPHLAKKTACQVGFSDHTLGTVAAVAAVALGATIIEKHITLARADGGPDAAFSLEPDEFEVLVRDCHNAYEAIGAPRTGRTKSENTSAIFRRSLYAIEPIGAGERFTRQNVRSIRPGFGLEPKHLGSVLDATARFAIERGTALSWEMISK